MPRIQRAGTVRDLGRVDSGYRPGDILIDTEALSRAPSASLFSQAEDRVLAQLQNVRWADSESEYPVENIKIERDRHYYSAPPAYKEIPLKLEDDQPFRPNIAIITKAFGAKGRIFEEGFKVEIVEVIYDPTKEDGRSIVIRVIDDRAPVHVMGAVACVSSHRLRLL